MSLAAVRHWSDWGVQDARPWSLRISEDVMVVDPERGVLVVLDAEDRQRFGPLLRTHASTQAGDAVVTLTTTRRPLVAEALAELRLLRSELADTLASEFGLAAVTAGVHPWSEVSEFPSLAPIRARPATDVAGILGRRDPLCGLRIDVAVPGADTAVRALDGLRLQMPLLLALGANSPFWRGRATGLASTRTALRASNCHAGLPRSFGSYRAYVIAVDALLRAGAAASPGSVEWDARLHPGSGTIEVTVMDAQTRSDRIGGLAALVQCLTRLYTERERAHSDVIPELVLENRSAAVRKGMRATMIDPAGHFSHPVVSELTMAVEACVPVACALACARELKSVLEYAGDPDYARQRSIVAASGLAGLIHQLSADFTEHSPRSEEVASLQAP